MLNNEVVPEGATHKRLDETTGPWYRVNEFGHVYVYRSNEWQESRLSLSDLHTTHFVELTMEQHDTPSLKDWDDRYPSVSDDVNHPKHYQLGGGLEAIDVIRASLTDEEYQGYLKGNLLKYRLRAGAKGDAQKDISKADWYKKELEK